MTSRPRRPRRPPYPDLDKLFYLWPMVSHELNNDRLAANSINRELTTLAETLAPEKPWATDEPFPDLTLLSNIGTSKWKSSHPGEKRWAFFPTKDQTRRGGIERHASHRSA